MERPVTSEAACPFCRPGLDRLALLASKHYVVIPDEYPRCTGHLLLVTRTHLIDHMDAPSTWMGDLEATQTRMRRFLLETFGRYSFLENGGHRKEVPHAHLHGVPVELSIDPVRFEGHVHQVESWDDLQRRAAGADRYAYVETSRARYFVPDDQYWPILNMIRSQTVAQTDGQFEGDWLARFGPQVVARTRALWAAWEKRTPKSCSGSSYR